MQVITGISGSGKTSFLLHIIRTRYKRRCYSNLKRSFVYNKIFSLKDTTLILDDFHLLCHKQLTKEYKDKWEFFLSNLRKNNVKLIVTVDEINSLFEPYIKDMREVSRYIRRNNEYTKVYHNLIYSTTSSVYIKLDNNVKFIRINRYFKYFNTFKLKRKVYK